METATTTTSHFGHPVVTGTDGQNYRAAIGQENQNATLRYHARTGRLVERAHLSHPSNSDIAGDCMVTYTRVIPGEILATTYCPRHDIYACPFD